MRRGAQGGVVPPAREFLFRAGLLPYGNGVHYDSEEQRRPLFQSLIADGTLPTGYATDDGSFWSVRSPIEMSPTAPSA